MLVRYACVVDQAPDAHARIQEKKQINELLSRSDEATEV